MTTPPLAPHLCGSICVFLLAVAVFAPSAPPARSITIVGASLADGTGGPLRTGNVRIEGDRIADVGDVAPGQATRSSTAEGLVLAPGFIDIHNHSTSGLIADPAAETQVAQGITTLVVGADGSSPWPIARVSGRAPATARRGERAGDGRPRDGAPRGHGRRLQAPRARRGDRADGGARRAGDAAKARSGCRAASSTRSAATARRKSWSSCRRRPPGTAAST